MASFEQELSNLVYFTLFIKSSVTDKFTLLTTILP